MLVRAITLWSHCRTVCVDPRHKVVTIERRILWLLSRDRTIPFKRIGRIDYAFDSLTTEWGLAWDPLDQLESFKISLCLVNPEEHVKLFSFLGEGSVATGVGGVLIDGDDVVDMSGDQESSSREYVTLLTKMTGKKLL